MGRLSIQSIFSAAIATAALIPGSAMASDSGFAEDTGQKYYSAILRIDDEDFDAAIADLETRGAIILHTRADMALAYIPEAGLAPSLPDSDRPDRKTRSGRPAEEPRREINYPCMDHARQWHDAHRIHEGSDLPQSFDGSGVIFGLCDTGFDATHPDFLTADGKRCRVSRIFYYDETEGTSLSLSSPAEIAEWRTDNPDMYHASHVAGIAAGAYPNGYQGMAPGAEIVFAGTRYLTDACILAGVEDMLAYAKEQNKPLVVNLSLGNYVGPHDGSTLFNRYLDLIAEECIVCLSAGNSGASDISLQYTFTEQKPDLIIKSGDWDGLNPESHTQIWSKDATPFLYNLNLWESKTKNYNYPMIDFSERETPWRVSADPEDPDYDETFAGYYKSGYVSVSGGISPLNGRFYVDIYHKCSTDIYDPASASNPTGRWALCWLANRVTSEHPGSGIELYADGETSFFRQCSGYPKGNPDRSISDLACGFNTISVGMYNNRSEVPLSDGSTFSQNVTPGAVSNLSSYGTLNDGRILPHTVAPGYMVVSASNSAYTEKYPEEIRYTNTSVEHDGQPYYYMTEWGTSMSCPYVAGTIATWLQAWPRLTVAGIRDIIARTNTLEYPSPEKPQNGQGHFRPYLGMAEVLKIAALEVVGINTDAVAVRAAGGWLSVDNPSCADMTIEVYSLSGECMKSVLISAPYAEIPLSALPRGIYAVKATSSDGYAKTTKIAI